jgi:hypothetical protein
MHRVTIRLTALDAGAASVVLPRICGARCKSVALANVTATDGATDGSASVRIGFLVGDVNGSRGVSISDLLAVNATLSQPVTTANYLRDLNLSGSMTLSDKLIANAHLAQALPAP